MKTKRQYIIFFISIFLMFIFNFVDYSILGLSQDAMKMIGIFAGAILLWLFIAIDWTSVLILCALTTLSIATPNAIIQKAFGNSTIWFLIFSFILTYSLSKTGFLRRCALFFINSKMAKKSNMSFAIMFWIAIMVVGAFVAPTVTFLLFYSLLQEIYDVCKIKKGSLYGNMLMAGTAFTTSISCAFTPIHVFPLMALGFYTQDTGNTISYFKYLTLSVPVCLILFVLMCFVLKFLYRKMETTEYTKNVNFEISKITKEEKISAIIFLFVVFAWVSPEFIKNILPNVSSYLSGLGTTFPAMAGVVILSAISVKGKPILEVKDAMKDGVTWNSIILCSTTLAVGGYLTSEELGITNLITDMFEPMLNNVSVFVLLLLVSVLVCVMTNLMSNIVTVTVTYSIIMPIIFSLNPELAIITTIMIGMLASLAFATPPAIAHIAIASGSGWTTPKDVLKSGTILTVLSIVLTTIFAMLFV